MPHLGGLLLLHWADTARLLARGGSVVYGVLLWLLVVWCGAVCHDGREGTAGPGMCSILCCAMLCLLVHRCRCPRWTVATVPLEAELS